MALASYEIGGYIPAYTGRRTFMGHWTETLHLPEKRMQAEHFFGSASHSERREMLTAFGIDYLFFGPRERAMGAFDPGSAGYLTPVFKEGEAVLYTVDNVGRS